MLLTLLSLIPGVGTCLLLSRQRKYRRSIAAAQDFGRLLGEADLILERTAILWENTDNDRISGLTSGKDRGTTGYRDHDHLLGEPERIRRWQERMNNMVTEYSIDIGQPGRGPGNR